MTSYSNNIPASDSTNGHAGSNAGFVDDPELEELVSAMNGLLTSIERARKANVAGFNADDAAGFNTGRSVDQANNRPACIVIDEMSPAINDADEPRIFFADEPRPTMWALLDDETRTAIELVAHGDLDAGGDLTRMGIAIEHAFDTGAGWHDVNPIVSVWIDGNVWNLELEATGNVADIGNEERFENEEGPAA